MARPRLSSDEGMSRFLVGVTGGSASGKTSICKTIARMMALELGLKTVVVPLDCFYKSMPENADPGKYNFDHPDALDMKLAEEVLERLARGESADLPVYNFKTHRREGSTQIPAADLILFEGIFTLNEPKIRDKTVLRIFVACDDDVRFCRRVNRDISQRGRTFEGITKQYMRFVRPAFRDFIEPMMKHANLIIPSTTNNRQCVEFIVQNLLNLSRLFRDFSKRYFFGNAMCLDLPHSRRFMAEDYLVNFSHLSRFIFITEEHIKNDINSALALLDSVDEQHAYQYYLKFVKNQLIFYGVVMLNRLLRTHECPTPFYVPFETLITGPLPQCPKGHQLITLSPPRLKSQMINQKEKRGCLKGVIVVSLLSNIATLKRLTYNLGASQVISILLSMNALHGMFEHTLGNSELMDRLFLQELRINTFQ